MRKYVKKSITLREADDNDSVDIVICPLVCCCFLFVFLTLKSQEYIIYSQVSVKIFTINTVEYAVLFKHFCLMSNFMLNKLDKNPNLPTQFFSFYSSNLRLRDFLGLYSTFSLKYK